MRGHPASSGPRSRSPNRGHTATIRAHKDAYQSAVNAFRPAVFQTLKITVPAKMDLSK